MNETKHTPGPWTVAYGMVYRSIAQGALGAGIAKMDRDEEMTSPTERDANAQLIAVAPELLASCQALLAMVDELLPLAKNGCGWGTIETDAARALIAKATGQGSSTQVSENLNQTL